MKKTILSIVAIVAIVNVLFFDFKKGSKGVAMASVNALACWNQGSDSGVSTGGGSGDSGESGGSGGFLLSTGEIGQEYFKPDPNGGSGGHNSFDITWIHDPNSDYGYKSEPVICPNQPMQGSWSQSAAQSHASQNGGELEVSTTGGSGKVTTSQTDENGNTITVTYDHLNMGTSCKLQAWLTNKTCVERGC